MKLSVIIVSWNTKDLLKECLGSLLVDLESSNLLVDSEIFVIDNNSADGSAEMVRENFPQVTLTANQDNKGFGRANNQAIEQARGEFVMLLNPDTKVLLGATAKLLRFAQENQKCGIVAPQLLNPDNSIQRSCRSFPSIKGMFYELSGLSRIFPKVKAFRKYKMLDFEHNSLVQVDQPEGACLLIRKSALDEVGSFDERFFMLFEEVDLCLRFKKSGWQIWFNPESKIVHHYGQSIKQVKAKMIWSSHNGMFYFWAKHNKQWYYQLLKPLLWIFLKSLAVLRITFLKVKNAAANNNQKSQPEKQVLELGCGKGRHASVLSKNANSKVTGIDLSEDNITKAKASYPNLDFRVMSAENLEFEDSIFDEVYAYDIYEHVDDLTKALQETARVIKKSGRLIVNIPAEKSEEWLLKIRPTYHEEIHHVRIFRGNDLQQSVEQCGFKMFKKQNRDFSDHLILYYMFTATGGSDTQLGIGDWRNSWVGRILFAAHAFTKPNLVFTSPLKFIPLWLITIPVGQLVNYFGNKKFPKSVYYEFIKL